MTGKGLRGRQLAELLVALPVVLVLLLAFPLVTGPHFVGGGPQWYESPVAWQGVGVVAVGVGGFIIGFVWMLRIYRSTLDAEARPSSWRSRSH